MFRHLYRGVAIFLVAVLLMGVFAVPALAFDARTGNNVTVASDEVVQGDLYVAGTSIVINGIVHGDVFGAGQTLTINGVVTGGVTFAGQTLTLNGEVLHGVRFAGTDININGDIGRDLVAAGSDVTLSGQARIDGDLILAAGTALVDGQVTGSIKGAGGSITITAAVGGDVIIEVDELTVSSSASISGDLTYTSDNAAQIQSGAFIGGSTTHKDAPWRGSWWLPTLAGAWVIWQVVSFLMILLAGVIIVLIAGRRVRLMADSMRKYPWQSLGWGTAIFFLTPIAAIFAMVTVIGIPLGLIVLLLYGIALYLSQIPVALLVGKLIIRQGGALETQTATIGALALGLFILFLVRVIPFVGWLIGLFIIIFGLGSLVTAAKKEKAAA